MCTAATYQTKDFYFGRTLDYEISYGDQVVITPRNYGFHLRSGGQITSHYAMIGMACVMEGYPLYYDAVNEKGLGIAGLNFVGNAHYHPPMEGKENITQFELIPRILGTCATVKEARQELAQMNLTDTPFTENLPVAQLHWLIADKNECITLALHQYSRGMGAIGLPGDLSSQSRFVRVAFVKMNALSGDSEGESVSQFFHILGSVDQQRGCCKLGEDKYEITLYTSCCNADKGIYYYTTYDNHQISGVDMHQENLDGTQLIAYAPVKGEQIYMQN